EGPGAGADAADADDLAGRMDVAIALEQMSAVARQSTSVRAHNSPRDVLEVAPLRAGHHVLDRRDAGRDADDPKLAVDGAAELLERAQAVLRAHLGDVAADTLDLLARHRTAEAIEDPLDVEAGGPNPQVGASPQ